MGCKKEMTYLDINHLLGTRANDLDSPVLLFLIELLELAFFLPVVHGSDHDHDNDCNHNSHTCARRVI